MKKTPKWIALGIVVALWAAAAVTALATDGSVKDTTATDNGTSKAAVFKTQVVTDPIGGKRANVPYVRLDAPIDLDGATVNFDLTNVTAAPGATPSPSPAHALMVQGYTSGIPVPVSIPTLPTATRVSSIAYEASHVLKASAGILISVTGYNSGSAQFIQLFNSATVPADTAVPVAVFAVAATSNFSYDAPITGIPFTTGIAVSNSSTGPTKTIGSADVYFTAVVK